MQECRVCGLLFLGGGACPSCGSQVSLDVELDNVVMDDDSIPGLDDVVDAIGSSEDEEKESENLPFGMGAKAEVLQSSLPFGVGSFSDGIEEVAIPLSEHELEGHEKDGEQLPESIEVPSEPTVGEEEIVTETIPDAIEEPVETSLFEPVSDIAPEVSIEQEDKAEDEIVRFTADAPIAELSITESSVSKVNIEATPMVLSEEVPEMWRIDAAEVDMDEIYSQDEQVIEVSFDDDLSSGDVEVTFDEFHHSPVEDSMASDDDAPELHPARALPTDASGQPEIERMIDIAFTHMSNSSWVEAAHILSTASTNRPNDSTILNNLGLALLQSALEMDASGDPMSSSQYEAAIMALRQGAKIDTQNNTILLNLGHTLLVSGRAEKALGVINVARSRDPSNIEIENTLGACLIQLGRDDEAITVLSPYADDKIVSGNIALI